MPTQWETKKPLTTALFSNRLQQSLVAWNPSKLRQTQIVEAVKTVFAVERLTTAANALFEAVWRLLLSVDVSLRCAD